MRSPLRKPCCSYVFTPFIMLIALALSGAICRNGPYEQKISKIEGEFSISLVDIRNTCNDALDDAEVICLPGLSFSPPVDWVEVVGDAGVVFSASCGSTPDCIESLSCDDCFDEIEWTTDEYDDEYGIYTVGCEVDDAIMTGKNTPECNGKFTVFAGNSQGEEARLIFYNLYEYDGPEWGW